MKSLRQRTERLIFVLMPESSKYRAAYSPDILELARQELEKLSRDFPLEIFDLRALLGDSLFFDHAHLNAEGRQALSSKLLRLLVEGDGDQKRAARDP